MARWVLHVDLDQFIAAVEVLRRPELAGLPVVVGGRGDPTERAVVSTASYEAREFGVRSGMPLRLAARKCPDAVFLPVDGPTYDAASAVVMETLRAHDGAVVQVLGWDEAFVGLTTAGDDVAEAVAHADAIRAEVLEASELHCSVGVGDTTVRAKIATDFGKPRGTFVLTADTWFDVMGERPTTALWGVGNRIAARLASHGYDTVRQLAEASDDVLTAEFGPRMGPHYRRLGRGLGATTVDDTPWVARAHGRETTYQSDLTDAGDVEAAVLALSEQVVEDIRREDRACARVHLKVRFAPFFTTTRIRKLTEPTFDPSVIATTALELLHGLDDDRPIRLLGVRAEMVPPEGGYEPPRTTGRGGPAARDPGLPSG
ncbi:DNA polymerase IV [Knoellia flava TL1]|uniref:DNA-directed DNA polymerase n=2 Tax=Knoellia flava TaxID=913969 RepID=A0A8H9FTV8_9MICO|nr:DNA polymerase IV [Knoellia flava]KGN35929.1 DNA polymerase IV [Knoellia flava TL1]GGB79399.1 DNA polymerase IV [Knoellia flava]